MRKFIMVSLYIFTILGLFIAGAKMFFDDMIHSKDYAEINHKEVKMEFEGQSNNEGGVYAKFKIINNSRFVFLLTDAKLEFPSYNSEGDLDSLLELNLHNQYKDQNEKIMTKGIEKYSEGYITFLIPRGLKLDSRYFDFNAVSVQYQGVFKVHLPFLKNRYLAIGNHNGSYQISNSRNQINFEE